MPPRKKNNKKGADDWEVELGEPAAAAAVPETKDEPAEADAEEEFPAGGLMAMMRKKQKKKKGKQADEDFVEGEDPSKEDEPDLAEKAPVEASIEDEFALPDKKGKGKNAPAAKPAKEEDEDDERGADGKVLTKAQKEKLKKEREKQRKKENVSLHMPQLPPMNTNLTLLRLLRRRGLLQLRKHPKPRSLLLKQRSKSLPAPNLLRVAKERS